MTVRQPPQSRLPARARDEALAARTVLFEAHARARALAAQLELEAETDPRIRDLFEGTRTIQRGIAAIIDDIGVAPRGGRPAVSGVLGPDCCATEVPA